MYRPNLADLKGRAETLTRRTGHRFEVRKRWDGRPGLFFGNGELSPGGQTPAEFAVWLDAFTEGIEWGQLPAEIKQQPHPCG